MDTHRSEQRFQVERMSNVMDTVFESEGVKVNESFSAGDLETVVLRTLRDASEPLTVVGCDQQLPRPYRGEQERLKLALEKMVDRGQVHRHSPYRGKADRFWDRSPFEYAERLLTTQTHGRYSTKSELITQFKARCRDLPIKNLDMLIRELAKSGKLHAGKFLGSRAVRYSADPIDAAAVASNAMAQIVKRFSMSTAEIKQLFAGPSDVQYESGTCRGRDSNLAADEVDRQHAGSSLDASELIWDAIGELCPEGGGSIVPIAEVRRVLAFKVDRETLDESLWSLERDGRLDFTVHPDPSGLTSDHRRDQLTDRSGRVFDMLIIRR